MSAALIKHGLKKTQRSNSIYNVWKRKNYYSVSDTITRAPIVTKQYHQVQQSKAYSRFPPKVKELELPTPGVISSTLSSARSSRIGLVTWYLGMVKSRPIITKSITCALIYTAADLTSQTIARPSSEPYDLVRTLRMAGYGMLILGPSLHFWFNFVSKALPKRDLVSTLKKIVLGQAIYGPTMTVVFFSVNAALQGENSAEIVARLKRDLIPTMINGVKYWPLCDFLTFKFVPVHLQVRIRLDLSLHNETFVQSEYSPEVLPVGSTGWKMTSTSSFTEYV